MSIREQLQWQDGALLPQLQLGPRIGALKEQVSHAMFFINVPMTLVNLSVGYYATPIQNLLPLWLWYTGAMAVFAVAVVGYHVLIHKSWVRFTTGQGADVDANPQYERMVEEHEQLLDEIVRLRQELQEGAE